jgi:dTDP-4-dehydrorhamnose 3,5-epimerase
MKVHPTVIAGVVVVETTPFTDYRGSFARWFCERELAPVLGERRIVQINHSRTVARGAVRGMHYQHPPCAEMKLVRCVRGRVWDVAVDLRMDSPTLLTWHAEELTPDNARMLVIPEGCAHGFQALEPDSELLYLHTAFYTSEAEDGVLYDDPRLAIAWPLAVTDLSERDQNHLLLDRSFTGISL